MAVVINEFEVVPAGTPPAGSPEPADRPTEPSEAKRPPDPERDVERVLSTRQARALRLMAV